MFKKHPIHLIGIGGIGMSGIAEVLINLGYPVSGSDLKKTSLTHRLKKKGARLFYGHQRHHVEGADVVVVSSAISKDNPELLEAIRSKLLIIPRAEMLAELMRFSKYGIAVAGTHGKTTTTSLVASLLYAGGLDPTMIIGGKLNSFRSNARLGKGDFLVAEADESDGSFLKLSPAIAVITSIDREHMDYYKEFHWVTNAFLEFANKVPFYGAVVACIDHPVVKTLMPDMKKRFISYGLDEKAMVNADNLVFESGGSSFDLKINQQNQGRVTVNLLGKHNVLNSLAAIAVGYELGIPLSKMKKALKEFKGIHRRCEILLNNGQVTVLDDYGHHPEEIRATLDGIRSTHSGRIVTLFQPHRYTRTQDLFNDFKTCFDQTDVLLVTDIYPAGEPPIAGVNAEALVRAIADVRGKNHAMYLPKDGMLVNEVVKMILPGDILLSLGAGDVTQIGRECAKKLEKNFVGALAGYHSVISHRTS